MARIHPLKIELLTEESIKPYGEFIAAQDRHPDFRGIGTDGWITPFRTEGTLRIMALRSRYQGFRFNKLERHHNLTQSFIPMGGAASLIAFAPPTDPNDPNAIPSPEQVRAFLLDNTKGYVLKKGTWHSLDRYPLYPPHCNWVILTDDETAYELSDVPREEWRLTQVVDYEARFGVTFEFSL